MKRAIAVVIFGAAVMFLAGQWGLHQRVAASRAESQIYIHDTPVCVAQEGGGIVARIGECGFRHGGEDPHAGLDRDSMERMPFHGGEGHAMELPPGHPPIGEGILPDDGPKRSLI